MESGSKYDGNSTLDSSILSGSASGKAASSTASTSVDVDEDIVAFYQAKEELLKRRGGQGR